MKERPRRLRQNPVIRNLCAETRIYPDRFIMPYFVCEGNNKQENIESMPGISRVSVDLLLEDLARDIKLGIRSVILFGIPDHKDEFGTGAYADDGIVQQAVRAIRENFNDLLVITDVCLCEFTSHGHCGIVKGCDIINDPSLELHCRTALSHARAGAHIVAPSDMMDGRVGAIREALDNDGRESTAVMSYSVKYASAFYGPFRDAAGSAPCFGDRKTYQMDPANAREALREIRLDESEGADILMVKPALSYLDVICRVRSATCLPLCAYNVSGEYAMVKSTAALGRGDEGALVREIMTSIFRAGADMIISYHTRDILKNRWHD